ncbi:MFS transporter [Sporosarcina sp. FSL K6-1522]|uniref:MFS transporter n=1 Tax=Sporosarcina sp. FSL K6-1522 TaxID=2921554 RepID=UPI003159C4A4
MELNETVVPKTTKSQWIQFSALVFGAFIAIEAMAFQAPAIPVIAAHFEVPSHLAGLIVLSFYIVSASLYPITGRLADKHGRKRVLLIGIGIFAIAEFAAAVSPTFSFLLVARVFQGVGVSCIFPIVIAYIGIIFQPEQRGIASGIFNSVQAVAAMLGAGLAGFLVKVYGWPIIYWISGVLAVAGFLVVLFFIKESKGVVKGSMDFVGILLLFVTTACILSVSTLVGQFGIASPYTLGTLATGVLAAALLWFFGNRIPNPLIELSLLKKRVFALAALGYLTFTAALQLFIYSMSFFLTSRPGGDVAETGLFFMFNSGAAAIGGVIIGKLADKVNNKKLLICTLIIPTTALLIFSRIDASTSTSYILLLAAFFGVGTAIPIFFKYALNVIPTDKYGAGSGLLSVIRDFGAPLGSVTGIVLFTKFSLSAQQNSLTSQAAAAGVNPDLMGAVQQAGNSGGKVIDGALATELQTLGIRFEELMATALGEGATMGIQNMSLIVASLFASIIVLSLFLPQKKAVKEQPVVTTHAEENLV